MPVQYGVELICRLAVAFVGQTTIVFDSCRVIDVAANHCMMEDRVDCCSS